jgi:hypothetical protein
MTFFFKYGFEDFDFSKMQCTHHVIDLTERVSVIQKVKIFRKMRKTFYTDLSMHCIRYIQTG